MPKAKPKVPIVCKHCGKTFFAWPCLKSRKVWCSKTCRSAYLHKTCKQCNKSFDVKQSRPNQLYCSKRCSSLARGFPRRKNNDKTSTCLQDIIDSYLAGENTPSISKRLDVSVFAICRRLKLAGIPRRNGGNHTGTYGHMTRARDSHCVKSGLELAVCNWLSEHDIPHEYEPRLPWGTNRNPFHADFRIGDFYVEVWGMLNLKSYREKRREKIQLYHKHNLQLIEIFPRQIYSNDYSPLSAFIVPH